MKSVEYEGFQICYSNPVVGDSHPEAGKYLSCEFMIGFEQNGAFVEHQYVPDPLFFPTEKEAETATLIRARKTIEERLL